MIAGVEVANFTAFGSLQLSLSPRLNVVVGSNGTGENTPPEGDLQSGAGRPASVRRPFGQGTSDRHIEEAAAAFLARRKPGRRLASQRRESPNTAQPGE